MEFVLAVLVVAVLAGLGWPGVVRNRPYFSAAMGAVAAAMALETFADLSGSLPSGSRLIQFLAHITEIGAFLLLAGAGGGITLSQLLREVVASIRSLRP